MWLVLMLLALLQTDFVVCSAGKMHRVKRATHTCESDETQITMPYTIESNVQCAAVISKRQNLYTMDYRKECQRWLGLSQLPSNVPSAYVETCQEYGSSTKYRVSVCCKGSVSGLRCFTCQNETNSYDCSYNAKVTSCSAGEVCMTEYKDYRRNSYSYGRTYARCAAKDVCQAQYSDHSKDCTWYIPSPNCTHCCDSSFCNLELSSRWIRALDNVCMSSPCYNGGTCVLNSTLSRGYHCICRPGFSGDRCDNNPCRPNPCKYPASCSVNGTDYRCHCPITYTGKNCSQAAPQCSTNHCLHGGICYDHGRFGPKCLCPEGRIGIKCELSSALTCSNPSAYYNNTGSWRSASTSTLYNNCTALNEYIKKYYTTTYMSSCAYHMSVSGRPIYKNSVHGLVKSTQATSLQYCKAGEDLTEYKLQICCPTCYSNPCQNGGWCRQKSTGDYSCQCRFGYEGKDCENKAAICVISGDPHFVTFDGKKISFQGGCLYNYVSPSLSNSGVPPFNVLGKHEYRNGNTGVSYISFILLNVGGHTIKLARNGSVLVDGQVVYPDKQFPGFVITKNGRFNRIQTEFGLIVESDGSWTAIVKVPESFGSKISGICGNFDGNAQNDLVTSAGDDVSSSSTKNSDIGNSYQVPDPDDAQCKGKTDPDPAPCSAAMQATVATNQYCGLMEDTSGIFAGCVNIHGSDFYENCEYDVCSNQANMTAAKEAACGSLEAFSTRCANDGFVVDWRATANCPMKCDPGKVYKRVTAACPATCENPDGPETCNLPDTESCVCPGTTVLINGTCANASLCECPQGKKLGDRWLSADCEIQYTCEICKDCTRPVGKVYENGGFSCPSNQECITIRGVGKCQDMGPIDGGWGPWDSWSSCTGGQPSQMRTRQCDNPAPANGGSTCPGGATESRSCTLICGEAITADRCENYEDGYYLADPCDCKNYYQCAPTVFGRLPVKRTCAPCTCWVQEKLDCAQLIPNCNAAGASTSGGIVTGNICQRDGQTKSASSKSNEYKWYIFAGSVTMPCPVGTSFSLGDCDCVHDLSAVSGSAPKEELCIDFNKNRVETSSKLYTWIAGIGVQFTSRAVGGTSSNAASLGPGAYINIPFFSNNEFKSLSVSFWIRTTAGAGPQWIIVNNECPDNPTFSVQINGNSLRVTAYVDLVVTSTTISSNTITAGAWYNIVIVFTGENLILYINGSQVASQPLTGVLQMNHCSMWLGHQDNSGTFDLDDVCFYSGVLSSSAIAAQYGG